MNHQFLYINGVFKAMDPQDRLAAEMESMAREQLLSIPDNLKQLPSTAFPLLPYNVLGIRKLRSLFQPGLQKSIAESERYSSEDAVLQLPGLAQLADELSAGRQSGLIMTMGKGGVGKTIAASAIAVLLARKGHEVLLTTTDPAAHIQDFIGQLGELPATLSVERIDPKAETQRYIDKVLEHKGQGQSEEAKKLILEDLKSPCTEEVAVFHAFSKAISMAKRKFVVMDTAPTGHTLLLLDTAGSYHRDISAEQCVRRQVENALYGPAGSGNVQNHSHYPARNHAHARGGRPADRFEQGRHQTLCLADQPEPVHAHGADRSAAEKPCPGGVGCD